MIREGATLATGSFDTTAKLWNVESSPALSPRDGPPSSVEAVAFINDGAPLGPGPPIPRIESIRI